MLKVKRVPKPLAALIKKAKKYHIKVTRKVGGKRIYKRFSILKKQLKKAMRKMRKSRKVRKSRKSRKSRFGFGQAQEFTKNTVNYGYNQPVNQYPGTPSQSSSYIASLSQNSSRPVNMALASNEIPVYGTYKEFFGQAVPSVIPPEWNRLGQPDNSYVMVGSPQYRFSTGSGNSGFGKRLRKGRYNVRGSPCNKLRMRVCKSNPNCSYTKRGCRRRLGTVKGGLVFEGPSLSSFGKKRRYNVSGSSCNKLKKRVCQSSPNCSYTKRGCRRRKGTVRGGLVFEGPSLPSFGKRRRVSKKKPSLKKLLKMHKIKLTVKRGGKRVKKTKTQLVKEAMRKHRAMLKRRKH